MSGDIKYGIVVTYDGKSVVTGTTATSEQLKSIGVTADLAGAKASAALDRTGISAKQTAAALRGVPAQFTDIFTSIAAGQNPMQVMLQQGGQLKDMFGGVGPAARALGGYIGGLVNPFTVAAAAAAGLAYVYHQGTQESDAYSRALILSGNAAGTTAAQMADAARRVATATGGTQGVAADALAQGIAGGIPGAALSAVAEAAVRMQQVTGRAIDGTVAEFAKLARDPVAASVKLNEQYNYLTESAYRQIKALEDQGRHADAAALAMSAYADAVSARSGEIVANLGPVEDKWLGIKAAAVGAIDAVFKWRPADDLEKAVGKVQDIQAKMRDVKKNAAYDPGTARAELVLLEDQLVVARAHMVTVRDKANASAAGARAEAERAAKVKAGAEYDKEGLKFLDRKTQMEREITRQRQLGIDAGRSEEEIQKRILAITENYTEKKAAKRPVDPIDVFGGGSFITKDKDTAARIRESFEFENWAQRELLKDEARGKSEAAAASKIYADALQHEIGPIDARARQLAEERENAGKSEAQIISRTLAIFHEARATAAANGALQEHLDFYDREIASIKTVRTELDLKAKAQADWLSGAKGATQDYLRSTEDAAGQTRRAWAGTWRRAEEDLTQFFMSGKLNVRGFVQYTLSELARIKLAQPLVKSLAGASDGRFDKLFGGGGSLYSMGSVTGAGGWDYTGMGYGFANGGTFDSPDLHRYVNTVVDRPTRFRFAKGGAIGEMGEAGPESIMPLKRDKQGRLGVIAEGAGGGGSVVNLSHVFEIDARGAAVGVGPMLEGVVEAAVQRSRSVILAELNSGGALAFAVGRRK